MEPKTRSPPSKLIIFTLKIAIFSHLFTQTHTQAACQLSNKCIDCMADGCHTCKYRQTMADLSCGGGLTDNCEIKFEKDAGMCFQCMEGYSLSKDRLSCKLIAIKNCRIGYFDESNTERCQACSNSQPNGDRTACDQDIKVGNCAYAGSNRYGGIGCTNCNKGYAMDYYGKCSTECTEGCLVCTNGKCEVCNHFRGYYETEPGKCTSRAEMQVIIGMLMMIAMALLL